MNEQSYRATGALAPRIYEYVLAGLLLAVAAGGLVGYHVYHGFVTETIAQERAYWGIGLPFVGVAAGVYIFAYGWQRGDIEKAVRMSMWLTLGAVGILAAVLGTLALKRNAGSAGRSLLRYGVPDREPRSGWRFGDTEDDDEGTWSDGTIFGEDRYGERTQGADVLTVHCRNCGDLFTPVPPKALCPSCGASALGRTG